MSFLILWYTKKEILNNCNAVLLLFGVVTQDIFMLN